MPLNNVEIEVTFADGAVQDLAVLGRSLRIREGRDTSSWYDSPSYIELYLQVCGGEITKTTG